MSPTRLRPADCALLLAVPLNESTFLDNLASPAKDYAAHIASSTPGASKSFLWDRYREIADFVNRIGEQVAACGVFVQRDVTLDDFAKTLSRFSAVTLLAHWRCLDLSPRDIWDPRALLHKLNHLETFAAQRLRIELAATQPELQPDAAVDDETLRTLLAGFFQGLIDRAREAESLQTKAPMFHIRRAAIEDLFPNDVVPGACAEFFDGLKSARAFISAIPENYCGILDLSLCHSTVVGELIKQHRRSCTVIRNRKPATPFFKLTRYKLVIGELQREPASYVDALTRVQTVMLQYRTR
jgi:hypothetical protein